MKNWKTIAHLCLAALFALFAGCQNARDVPTVGFIDGFEDSTLEQAKTGFLAALKEAGFSEEAHTINLIYRNAQGDIPTLTQIVRYNISQKVTLLATNATLPTITALQNTSDIPVFMMVAPTPDMMKLGGNNTGGPANLYGVADNQEYIDTSFALISALVKPKGAQLRIGLLYNQSEPQSVEAYTRLQRLAEALGVELVARSVSATADAQLVAAALLNENIDAFFANPDNVVFGAFETIIKACNDAQVPVFTSEAGLVSRGAVAAYGADIYQWGYQAGRQAAQFLKTKSLDGLKWEMVKVRKHVFNPESAKRFGITVPDNYQALK